MSSEGANPESELARYLDPEGTGFTDGDAVQEHALRLVADDRAGEAEAFFKEQLERLESPFDRTVCRHWLRTLAAERREYESAADLSAAQIDDLLEVSRPESAACEAATAASFYRFAGLPDRARESLKRGYDCLRTARKNPGDMSPGEAAIAQGNAKRLLDDVRSVVGH